MYNAPFSPVVGEVGGCGGFCKAVSIEGAGEILGSYVSPGWEGEVEVALVHGGEEG